MTTRLIRGDKVTVNSNDRSEWNNASRLVNMGVARVEDMKRSTLATIMTIVWDDGE